MKKLIFLIFLILVPIAFAHAEENFDEAIQIINSKASCNNLEDSQLELIGDYLMEQMHPGEAHEFIDNAMGGEESDQLKQMHIRMAKGIYCGESGMMSMMGMGNMMEIQNMMTNKNDNSGFGTGLLVGVVFGGLITFIIMYSAKMLRNSKK